MAYLQQSQRVVERLHLDHGELLLGSVKQMETVPFQAELINDTLEPVKVVDVFSSCACSVAEIGKKELPPSGRTTVSGTLKTGMMEGHLEKKIEIHCQYKDKMLNVSLMLKAEVLPNLKVDKKAVAFTLTNRRVEFQIQPGVLGLDQVQDVTSSTEQIQIIEGSVKGQYTAVLAESAKPEEIRGHVITVRTTEAPICWPRIPFQFEEVTNKRKIER
ncbi:MAG: DUF1573 domain-containing protein, partial [Gemmataceae bacterium]